MQLLDLNKYKILTREASVLTEDEFGEKVLELKDKSIIKLFRVKRFISQATIYSPAKRFAKNVRRLIKLDIPTVAILELYNIKELKRTAVHYTQLEGVTVREYLQKNKADVLFLENLGAFLATMHNKGIYFRSAHFGNIIYTPEKQFGLIDVSDMSFSLFSLGIFKRLRNIKHIFRIREDVNFIQSNQIIETSYLEHCPIKNQLFKQKFLKSIQYMKQHACK